MTVKAACEQPPAAGSTIRTACNSQVIYTPDMPCVRFNDRVIYFCLVACKETFLDNPANSCLGDRLKEFL
jgi:hypothetical protein